MKIGVILEIFLVLYILRIAEGEQGLLSLTDGELVNSQLWKEEGKNLFIIKQGGGILPAETVEYVVNKLQDLQIGVIELVCEEDIGKVCPLFSHHEAVVKRGGGEMDVVGVDPSLNYNKMEYLNGILELMVGELVHVDSYASMMSSVATDPDDDNFVFVAVVLNASSAEYTSLLSWYITLEVPLPLIVTTSKKTLPIAHRPPYSQKELSFYLYIVYDAGQVWERSFWLKLMDKLSRRQTFTDEDKSAIEDMFWESMFEASLYPELPGYGKIPTEQLLEIRTHKLYLSYIYTLAEKKRDRIAARMSPDKLADDGLGAVQEEEGSGGVDDDMRGVLLTDPMGVDILMSGHNLVASFCKTGSIDCHNNLFAMESAQEVFNDHHLYISFHFLVVECDSGEDIHRFNLDSLPSYALYNSSKNSWEPGRNSSGKFRNILALIANETSHRELPRVAYRSEDEIAQVLTTQNRYKVYNQDDGDVYNLLGRPYPFPSIPSDLVLTDKNFNKRITMFEKIAVLFYLRWSADSKVILPHLIAAWERLDKSLNVSLGCLDCYSHTNLCYRFNVTSLPVLLLFTPSTLDTPSAPPSSIGVLDSTHFLQVLERSAEPVEMNRLKLVEATPTSLPTLLKNKLTTPLVLWCDDKPVSPLGLMFSIVALNHSKVNSELAFAWMNSSKHSDLLGSALTLESGNFPTVIAMQLAQDVAYQMEDVSELQVDTFGEHLVTFLNEMVLGTLEPAKELISRKWRPLYSPYKFPSTSKNTTQGSETTGEEEDVGEHQEMIEEPDMASTIPLDESPQVKEYEGERKEERAEKLGQSKEEL